MWFFKSFIGFKPWAHLHSFSPKTSISLTGALVAAPHLWTQGFHLGRNAFVREQQKSGSSNHPQKYPSFSTINITHKNTHCTNWLRLSKRKICSALYENDHGPACTMDKEDNHHIWNEEVVHFKTYTVSPDVRGNRWRCSPTYWRSSSLVSGSLRPLKVHQHSILVLNPPLALTVKLSPFCK